MKIYLCPNCKREFGDNAKACPFCGTPISLNTVQTQQPKKRRGLIIGICSAAAAAVIVFLIVYFMGGDKLSPRETVRPSASDKTLISGGTVVSDPLSRFTVNMSVNCIKNDHFRKYPVDILVDDAPLDTLPHGISKDYKLELEGGSHKIEFRINASGLLGNDIYNKDKDKTYKIFTVNVTKDMDISYSVKMKLNGGIEVTPNE